MKIKSARMRKNTSFMSLDFFDDALETNRSRNGDHLSANSD